MVRAFFGLGSNLGDRWGHLRAGVAGLAAAGPVVAVSPVYETDPVGGPAGQGPYLNAVAAVDTEWDARALLGLCHRLEDAAGRVRTERWGPRTLDVDLLLVDGVAVDEEDLVVPHPRMWERRFVVAPLADIAPDLVPGGWEDRVVGSVRRAGRLDG